MKTQELIALCIEIIDSFNPVIMTPDTHYDNFIAIHKKRLFDTE